MSEIKMVTPVEGTMLVKKVVRHNPKNPEGDRKYYLSAMHGGQIGIEQLSADISDRCSLRKSDVQGVLIALMEIMPKELCKGNMVSLGELGTFFVNVKSEGAETPEDLSAASVRGFRLVHLPTKKFKKHLRQIDVLVQKAP